jgi:hypothetical protein
MVNAGLEQLAGDLYCSSDERRAKGREDFAFSGVGQALGCGHVSLDQVAAVHAPRPGFEPAKEFSCDRVGPLFAGLVGRRTAVPQPEGHQRAGCGAAYLTLPPHPAPKGRGKAESDVERQTEFFSEWGERRLRATVALAEPGKGAVGGRCFTHECEYITSDPVCSRSHD